MEIGHSFLRHGEKQRFYSHADIQKAKVRAHITRTKLGKVAQVKEYQRMDPVKLKKYHGQLEDMIAAQEKVARESPHPFVSKSAQEMANLLKEHKRRVAQHMGQSTSLTQKEITGMMHDALKMDEATWTKKHKIGDYQQYKATAQKKVPIATQAKLTQKTTNTALKKHSQWSSSDYEYLSGKGYSDAEIKKKWDEEAKQKREPVIHKKAPDVVGYLSGKK